MDVNFNQFSKALFDPSGLPLFFKLMYKGSKVVKNGTIDWTCSTAQKLDKISLEEWIQNHWFLNKFNPNFTREFFYLLETCAYSPSRLGAINKTNHLPFRVFLSCGLLSLVVAWLENQ
jgi:hypothetical protein